MKKFATFLVRNKPTIYEVEVERISAVEDPSIMWSPDDAKPFRILSPESLYERRLDGIMAPPVVYVHSLFDSVTEATTWYKHTIESTTKARAERHSVELSANDLKAMLAEISVIRMTPDDGEVLASSTNGLEISSELERHFPIPKFIESTAIFFTECKSVIFGKIASLISIFVHNTRSFGMI